jgi:hypothetical protein
VFRRRILLPVAVAVLASAILLLVLNPTAARAVGNYTITPAILQGREWVWSQLQRFEGGAAFQSPGGAAGSISLEEAAPGTDVGTITVGTLTAARTYTFPDSSGTVPLIASSGTMTLPGNVAFSATGTTVDGKNLDNLQLTSPGAVNKTREEYVAFLDSLYTGYFSARYDNAEGWFESDSTGADGDGFTADVPFSYINAAALSYCGIKASQGPVTPLLQIRCASVIDKLFVSPVWAAGNDFTRTLRCTGSVGSPTCVAGSSISAGTMAARGDVFSEEGYPGAFLCWLYSDNLGIGSTRKATLKSFLDDTINATTNGYNQGDLGIIPMHLYLRHLAGTSQVSAYNTAVGASSGWAKWFDTAAIVLPYVTDAFAWNYSQDLAQNNVSNFQTIEYLGFQAGAASYESMVAAGVTPNATADARLRAVGLRMLGSLSHSGWPAGWLTRYGDSRQDLPGYALGYVMPALDQVMSNGRIFTLQERRWAKYIYDRLLDTFVLMDTYGGDAADGMVGDEPFGAAIGSAGEQDGDKAVGAGHVFRALAWHLILGNDTLEAEQPPNLAWYDWQQNTLVVSTPTYATYLYADIEGTPAFGDGSTTYDTASGAGNLGFLSYNPTNEHVIERPDEGQVSTTTAVSYGWRRLQNGLLIINSNTGSFDWVIDEDKDSSVATNGGHLRPLMKMDTFGVTGWGVSGGGSPRRPTVGWDPIWQDLRARAIIDRSNDTDAGNDDYRDEVDYTFHDEYIEEVHNVTAPGGACTACFAYYLLRPPNGGQVFLSWAGHNYDTAFTIPVRYEVQRFSADTDFEPSTVTITNGTCSVHCAANTNDGNGCVVAVAGSRNDSAGGAITQNVQIGSVRFNTDQTVTLTHTVDADMASTAAASNRVSYQAIVRKYSGSPALLATLDGGAQRSKSTAGGDTAPNSCGSAGEVDSDYQFVAYDSASDDSATVIGAGTHTLAVTNTSGSSLYFDAFQMTGQSPVRFLDSNTSGGWIPPAGMPSGDNDWYLELRTAAGTAGYVAYFPDKTLITAGLEARFRAKPTGLDKFNANPPPPVAIKLFGNNIGQTTVAAADATVPAFGFSVVRVPYNGDHLRAQQIYEQILRWLPKVRAFSGASATLTISVNEIGIDVTPATRVNVSGLDTVGALGVKLDLANDDIIITRSDTSVSGAKVSWSIAR